MVKRSKRLTDGPVGAGPPSDDDPVDDFGSLLKLSGDQVASGLAQGIGAAIIVYAIVRAIRGLARFLRGGSPK